MITLILSLLFGIVFAYLALQNNYPVTVRIGSYYWTQVPLFAVTLTSMLIGIVIASFISSVNSLASLFALRGKDTRIAERNQAINQLEEKIHTLELENAHLKGENVDVDVPEYTTEDQSVKPSIWQNFRHRFSF